MIDRVRAFQRGRACVVLLVAIVLGVAGCSDGPLAPDFDSSTAPRSLHPAYVDCDSTEDLRA